MAPHEFHFSGIRSCGDNNDSKFSFSFFENLQKHPGQLGFRRYFQ